MEQVATARIPERGAGTAAATCPDQLALLPRRAERRPGHPTRRTAGPHETHADGAVGPDLYLRDPSARGRGGASGRDGARLHGPWTSMARSVEVGGHRRYDRAPGRVRVEPAGVDPGPHLVRTGQGLGRRVRGPAPSSENGVRELAECHPS